MACRAWLVAYPPGSNVAANSGTWQSIADEYETLHAWWDGLE